MVEIQNSTRKVEMKVSTEQFLFSSEQNLQKHLNRESLNQSTLQIITGAQSYKINCNVIYVRIDIKAPSFSKHLRNLHQYSLTALKGECHH